MFSVSVQYQIIMRIIGNSTQLLAYHYSHIITRSVCCAAPSVSIIFSTMRNNGLEKRSKKTVVKRNLADRVHLQVACTKHTRQRLRQFSGNLTEKKGSSESLEKFFTEKSLRLPQSP